MIGKIVALLDGSTLAQSDLPHSRALAHAFQAEVTLLRVLEQERKTDTGRLDPINWHLRKIAAQSFLDEVSKATADDQIAAEAVLLEGAAANATSVEPGLGNCCQPLQEPVSLATLT